MTDNPLLDALADVVPIDEQLHPVWDRMAERDDFQQLVESALAVDGIAVNDVLMFLTAGLKRENAPKVAEVLSVLDRAIEQFDPSQKEHVHYANTWFEFLRAYIAKNDADTEKGKAAIEKLGVFARRTAFDPGYGNFYGLLNDFIMGGIGTPPYERAMAAIWEDIVTRAISNRCVDSENRTGGRKQSTLIDGGIYVRVADVRQYVNRYGIDRDEFGAAARRILGIDQAVPPAHSAIARSEFGR